VIKVEKFRCKRRGGSRICGVFTNNDPMMFMGGEMPNTVAGKQRSKFNATKHGIFSSKVLLPGESRKEYEVHPLRLPTS
jgi:hypothetical protein